MQKITCFVVVLFFLINSAPALVKNSDQPARGKWDFKLKKIWQIGNAGEDDFAEILDIDVLPQGNILVTDSKNFKVYILNKTGKLISSFVKRGEGPGEVKRLTYLQVAGNKIVIPDMERLHFFSHTGKYIETVVIPRLLRPRAFVSDNAFISAPYINRDAGKDPAKISLYNIKDKSERVIAQYKPFEKATASREEGRKRMVVAVVISGLTPAMTVHYRAGKIYYGMSDSYKIDMVDLAGKHPTGFYIEGRKRVKVSDKTKKSYFKKIGAGSIPPGMLDSIINGLPDVATYFHTIESDKNGLIYVFNAEPGKRYLQPVDIFSPGGKHLYSAEIKLSEGSAIERISFNDDLLILGVEGEDGSLKLVKYQIALPPV